MRVSVVTPVLNSVRHIEPCVDNVLTQGDVVLEHIFADGGSSDGTVEAIEAMQARHPHVRLLRGPDRGQSDAMNKGTLAARGEIVGLLNCDDFYQPGAVERGVQSLSGTEPPAFVAGDCDVLDEDGHRIYYNRPTDLRLEALLLGWKYAQFPCNPSAYFYHRQVHDIVGGYDLNDHLTMDLDFILKCAARVRMIYVPEHWGNFRLVPGTKSFDNEHTGAQRVEAVLDRHRRQLNAIRRLTMAPLKAAKAVRPVKWAMGRGLKRLGLR